MPRVASRRLAASCLPFVEIMYQSNRSLNIPPGHTPGIWRLLLPGREGIWWTKSFPGRGIWSLLMGAGNLIASFDFMLCRADFTWRDKSWRMQALMHSKRKIPDSWRTGWKAKACTSFVLYLKVFKNHLYYLWRLLNHVYIHSFRSIRKATEKFPGVGAFDHQEWTYDGAFEQLFGLGSGKFE